MADERRGTQRGADELRQERPEREQAQQRDRRVGDIDRPSAASEQPRADEPSARFAGTKLNANPIVWPDSRFALRLPAATASASSGQRARCGRQHCDPERIGKPHGRNAARLARQVDRHECEHRIAEREPGGRRDALLHRRYQPEAPLITATSLRADSASIGLVM